MSGKGIPVTGIKPTRALELILGLALGYSAYTTNRMLNIELPPDLPVDPLLQILAGLQDVEDRVNGREVQAPERSDE